MALTIHQHRLDGAKFRPSPNHGGALAGGRPDAIVIHFTGGASAASSIEWLCNPQAKASAHVVVGTDGAITQLVPFDIQAWHAGASSYNGRDGYNRYSVGIEIDNPGRLTRTENGGFVASFGRHYPADDVILARHRHETRDSYWLAYPEAQVEAVFALCAALCASYPIREILGHEEIARGRKFDPGPAFPLEKLRARLVEADRDVDAPAPPVPAANAAAAPARPRGYVTASLLNFRSGPSPTATPVAPPLPRGTMADVLGSASGWTQIRVGTVTGWVKSEHLKTG